MRRLADRGFQSYRLVEALVAEAKILTLNANPIFENYQIENQSRILTSKA